MFSDVQLRVGGGEAAGMLANTWPRPLASKMSSSSARHQHLACRSDDLDHLVGLLSQSTSCRPLSRPVFRSSSRPPHRPAPGAGVVVGAVAGHAQPSGLRLGGSRSVSVGHRRRSAQEIVDAGFGRDGGRRPAVVAGLSSRYQCPSASSREALLDATLDDYP